jgi:hypothetical protein
LPHAPAHRSHLGHTWDRDERRSDDVLLQTPELHERIATQRVDERVLEHPTRARREGADLEPRIHGQFRAQTLDALDDGSPAGRQIGGRIEHDVDIGHPGHRGAAHRRRARYAIERIGEQVRHVGGHFARRMTHPVPHEDDLRVRQIGDDVARKGSTPELAADGHDERGHDDDPRVTRAPRHDARDQGASPCPTSLSTARRLSASM